MNERYRFILVLLVGVGAVRLLLLDRGALALPDEWLYLKSLAALEHLAGARDVLRAKAGLIAALGLRGRASGDPPAFPR